MLRSLESAIGRLDRELPQTKLSQQPQNGLSELGVPAVAIGFGIPYGVVRDVLDLLSVSGPPHWMSSDEFKVNNGHNSCAL